MKTTSRIFLLFVLMALGNLSAIGQKPENHKERMERYRSMKIAFFTEKLDLSPEEAEKFWPLYNKYEQDKDELRSNRMIRSKEFAEQFEQLSESQAEEIIDNHIENRKKELQLDIAFNTDLKRILPARKIMKLYITEVEFKEYMLRQIREHKAEPTRRR